MKTKNKAVSTTTIAMITSLGLVVAAVAAALPGSSPQPQAATQSARQRILFDSGWRFQLVQVAGLEDARPIAAWRVKEGPQGSRDPAAAANVDTSGVGWRDARTGEDTFARQVGSQWFRTVLPDVPGPHRVLRFDGVNDNGTVFLNGHQLRQHSGYEDPFEVPLDTAWIAGGSNSLAVLVENIGGPGGIMGSVTLGRLPPQPSEGEERAVGFDDHAWRTVQLPHDYVVEGAFTNTGAVSHGSLPTPQAWYRKTFTLPASPAGKSVWLDFDGVFRDSTVYLNGKELGEHQSGYTPFRYDITKLASYNGQNVLAVHVNPRPFEGWWYEGAGIYRHVWLNIANPVRVEPWGVFVTSELPEPGPGGAAPQATLHIQTALTNAGAAAAEAELVSRVVDDRGTGIAEMSSRLNLAPGGRQELAQQLTVRTPRLWSLETPNLYHLETSVRLNGQTVDTAETPFGIRTIRFDAAKGFFLNGKSVKIQGVCNHQDFAGVGAGVPDTLEQWRVRKLKEMGANGWRMSHNPPNPELLDACDQLGMLVMDENRHLGDTHSAYTPSGTPATDLRDLADLILRDRNHPSIIMWSMCNEEKLQGTPEAARIFAAMTNVVRKLDTTRPISCAMNGGWYGDGIGTVEDLMGVNYNTQVYDQFHQQHPNMPMFASETASTTTTRGEYTNDRARVFVTSYNLTDDTWRPVAERPFMAGSFVWTGFDYKGEPSPYAWPCINSHFGIMDMCGFPKDNYYYYQSWWKTNPIVHIMPHWNWPGREGQNVRVIVFSNCKRMELSLNGTSLGSKEMPRNGHLEWTVAYAPGNVTAKGYNDEVLAASDTVETTGAPVALHFKTDRTALTADAEDLAVVEVDVLDAKGRIVPTAGELVTFKVEGEGQVAGVGNGNPGDHDPDKASFRHAFNGKCMVLAGATDKPGTIVLTATSPGLTPARLQLTSTRAMR